LAYRAELNVQLYLTDNIRGIRLRSNPR